MVVMGAVVGVMMRAVAGRDRSDDGSSGWEGVIAGSDDRER